MSRVIITSPSLDTTLNVSGVSSVVRFIIDNNSISLSHGKEGHEYVHFQLGKTDQEKGLCNRIKRIIRSYSNWKKTLSTYPDALIHYSFPLSTPSILRDPLFIRHALHKKRKIVVHIHGGLYLTSSHIPIIQKWLLKKVFALDVPFIVLSNVEKEILQNRWGVNRVEVLPNCPDIPHDKNYPSRCYNSKPLVLGYLGRIEVNKGMSELLQACRKLKDNGVDFKLLMAGKEINNGEYIPLFNSTLNDSEHNHYEYVGLVSGTTKEKFLASLDILVLPTYFEGLPMSLLECMSYGVVPVTTDVGSISTLVNGLLPNQLSSSSVASFVSDDKESVNGLFVPVKDIDSIVDAVKYLYSHRDVLRQLSVNARNTIATNFSVSKYIDKLNAIYSSMSFSHE